LISPIVWVFLLLLFAIFTKDVKRKKKRLWLAILALYFFCNTFILDEAYRFYESSPKSYDELTHYDVGIVLGGYANYDPTIDRINFGPNADRLMQALELYQMGYIDKILINGGSGSMIEKSLTEAEYVRIYLDRLGIPAEDLLFETTSRNTHENAVNAKKILDSEAPNGNYLLITSAFHMPRAKACFDQQGIATTTYPVAKRTGKRVFYFDHLFIPRSYTLYYWDELTHEAFGFLSYKIFGYV